MLKVLTEAPRDLMMYLWDYQLTVLNSICVYDEQQELENNLVCMMLSCCLCNTNTFSAESGGS